MTLLMHHGPHFLDPDRRAERQELLRELGRDTFRYVFWFALAVVTMWAMMSMALGWTSGLL